MTDLKAAVDKACQLEQVRKAYQLEVEKYSAKLPAAWHTIDVFKNIDDVLTATLDSTQACNTVLDALDNFVKLMITDTYPMRLFVMYRDAYSVVKSNPHLDNMLWVLGGGYDKALRDRGTTLEFKHDGVVTRCRLRAGSVPAQTGQMYPELLQYQPTSTVLRIVQDMNVTGPVRRWLEVINEGALPDKRALIDVYHSMLDVIRTVAASTTDAAVRRALAVVFQLDPKTLRLISMADLNRLYNSELMPLHNVGTSDPVIIPAVEPQGE